MAADLRSSKVIIHVQPPVFGSKSATAKKCEIKYEKNIISCETSGAVDPAKRDVERTRIELAMVDFRTRDCALPAHHAELMGLMGFPFGNMRLPGVLVEVVF
jgi:hypothetical protein